MRFEWTRGDATLIAFAVWTERRTVAVSIFKRPYIKYLGWVPSTIGGGSGVFWFILGSVFTMRLEKKCGS